LNVTAIEVAEQLDGMEYTLCHTLEMWNLINNWTDIKTIWINTPIKSLDFDEIDQYIQKIQETTFSLKSGLFIVTS